MNCAYCGRELREGLAFCTKCGRRQPVYGAPEGFVLDRERGLYIRAVDAVDESGRRVRRTTLFDPVEGSYRQQDERIPQTPEPAVAEVPPTYAAEPEAPQYAPPEGFLFHEETGLYFRENTDAAGGVKVTWFDPYTGECEQVIYPLEEDGQPDEIPPVARESVQIDERSEQIHAPEPEELPKAQYTPPAGFLFHPQSGLYYRQDAGDQTRARLTWFDPASGEYAQLLYERELSSAASLPEGFALDEASGLAWRLDSVDADGGGQRMRSTWYDPESGECAYQNYLVTNEALSDKAAPRTGFQPPRTTDEKKRGKRIAVAAVAAVLAVALAGGGFWAVRSGLVSLPAIGGGSGGTSGPFVGSREPIAWVSPSLESAVREHIGKPEGDITSADLAGIKEIHVVSNDIYFGKKPGDLDESERGDLLPGLADFAHFPDLTWISIINQPTPDLSELAGLSNLGALQVSNCDLTDISPLKSLKNLTWLNLKTNKITDISVLPKLPKLGHLHIHSNPIEDFGPLAELDKLTHLYIHNTGLSDLSLLADKTNMEALAIGHNPIGELSSLGGMTKLNYLYAPYAGLGDVSPLGGLKELEYLNLGNNAIEDISVLAGLPKLDEVNLDGNPIADYSPVDHVRQVSKEPGNPGHMAQEAALPAYNFSHTPDEWKELLSANLQTLADGNGGQMPEAEKTGEGVLYYRIPNYNDSYFVFGMPDWPNANVLQGLLISMGDLFDRPSVTLEEFTEVLVFSPNDFTPGQGAFQMDGRLHNTIQAYPSGLEMHMILSEYEYVPEHQMLELLLAVGEFESTPFTWLWFPNPDAAVHGAAPGAAIQIGETYLSENGKALKLDRESRLVFLGDNTFEMIVMTDAGGTYRDEYIYGSYVLRGGQIILTGEKFNNPEAFGVSPEDASLTVVFQLDDDGLVLHSPEALGIHSPGDLFRIPGDDGMQG